MKSGLEANNHHYVNLVKEPKKANNHHYANLAKDISKSFQEPNWATKLFTSP